MDDQQQPTEGESGALQSPHWRGADGVVPMKLIMQPGGLTVEVTRLDTLVGRHGGVDLRLPLPDVSRQHCRFVYQDNAWNIVDLSSLNGVYVNDVKVAGSQVLRQGDRVRIGGFTFEVDLASGKSTECSAFAPEHRVLRSIANMLQGTTEEEPKRQAS